MIEDAEYTIQDGICTVTGNQIVDECFLWEKEWENTERFEDKEIKYDYKTFLDILKRKKSPYVTGVCILKKRKPYKAIFSHFKIVQL